VDASTLATLQETGQVAGAAGDRDQQKPLMLFCLEFEPKKIASFQILPVEIYASRQKNGVSLDSLPRAIGPVSLRSAKALPPTSFLRPYHSLTK
jgi:hypothetical protein